MAMTLEELRRKAGTSQPAKTTAPTMTLAELRKRAGTTAPERPARVQPIISQPAQTAGVNAPAVSYADKLATPATTPTITAKEKYGNTLYAPASMYAVENEKRNKLNYIVNDNYKLTSGAGMANPYAQLDYVNEAERMAISDLVAKKDYESAYRYLLGIEKDLNARQAEGEHKQVVEFAKEHPLLASGVSVGSSLFKPIEYAGNMVQYATDKMQGKQTDFDANAENFAMTRYSNAVNEGIMQDDGVLEQLLKGTGMSIANQAAISGLVGAGPLTELVMAAQAAQDSLYENTKRGLSRDEAILNAAGKGVITYWTERFFPSEKILGIGKADVVDTIWKQIGKASLAEGIEEVAENVVSNVWDSAQLGDKSEFSELVQSFKAQGYSKDDATVKAFIQKYIYDSLIGFAGGALAGGFMGGGAGIINSTINGRNAKQNNTIVNNDENAYNVSKGGDINEKVQDTRWPGRSEIYPGGNVANSTETIRSNGGNGGESRTDTRTSRKIPLEDSRGNRIARTVGGKIADTAVSENGKPIKVYHFTQNMDFDTFGEGDTGFHFGTEEQAKQRKTDLKAEGGRTIQAYLNIKKPVHIGNDIMNTKADALALKLYSMDILTQDEWRRIYKTAVSTKDGSYNSEASKQLREILKTKGIDGFSYDNLYEGKGRSYIALYPEQVVIVDDGRQVNKTTEGTSKDVSNSLPENKNTEKKTKPKKKAQKKEDHKLPESVGAMKSGYYAAIEEYGAFPEGEKATNPVDVPMSVDGQHGVTRGVRSIMEAAVTKEDMLADYQKAVAAGEFNYDINRDKDAVEKAVNFIEKYGFKNAYEGWRKKIDNKLEITKDDMTQAQIMYASAVEYGDYDTAMKLATDISIQATKAGQVVQSMRILKKTTPDGRLYYAKKSLEAIQDEINEKYGDNAPELKVDDKLWEKLRDAQTDEAIREVTVEFNQAIADQLPFSWSNFIASWRYLAMLGNTRTQLRNVLSNCISGIAQEWTNFVQTAGETAFVKAGANIERTSAIKTTEWQRKQAEADFKAIEKDLYGKGKFRNDNLTAIQKLQNPFDFKGKGGKVGEVAGKGLTRWNDWTNRWMERGDKLFSEPAYKRYYARYLAANKINSEEQLTSKVKLRARAWATKQANESVFRESNALAEWIGKQETQLMNKPIPGARTAAKLVGGLMPFRSTPLNITKRAFEYTPVGIATELGWQVISNKRYGTDYNVTQIINKAAKSFSGTVLIGLGYALAKAGILSGGLDDDKEDDMKKQMGQQEYALNTKNWSMTMDWAGAGMMPLFVGAQMYQMTEEESDGFFMAMLDTLANASAPVMETSMMTGLMSAIKDAKYEDDITKAGMTFLASGLGSYIGQFVPTALGQISRALDDTSRTAYTNTKGVIRPLAKTAEKMQNKTPFSVWNVPYMDVWGNDEKNFDFGIGLPGRLLYNMVSPGYIEKKSTDKVEKMLMELYDKTGETSLLPSNDTTSKKVNGENIRFTDKQFEKYTKEYGQTAYDRLDNLFSDKRFNSLTDKEKIDAIDKVYDYATVIASESTVKKTPEKADKNRKAAIEIGVPSYDVFAGRKLADREINENDSTSEAEAILYINKHGKSLTKEQKAALYKVVGTDKGYTDSQNKTYVNTYADIIKSISSGMSEAKVREIYENAHDYAREISKVKAGVEDSTKALENKESALIAGVSPYYIFTGKKKADTFGDKNGYTSKNEVIAYIESLGVSTTEKAYLFAALGNSNWKNPYV